jgi:hypothetical protein
MGQQALIEHVANFQGVSSKYLSPVKCELQNDDMIKWASLFFKEKQCFSNALNLSAVDECDYVLGYVYLRDLGIAIEHAWNCDEQGHFDLTAQIFWKNETQVEYVELLRLESTMAKRTFEQCDGVDHMALRRSDAYKYLFNR